MKFRFCGELDCPDWVLAEIATLSKITSIKMKILCNIIVDNILGVSIDFGKITRLTSDAKYDSRDIKASIASLMYIFASATKHSVEEDTLSNELQQLGLPKESTAALCRVFFEKFSLLQEKLKEESLKFTKLEEINWRVDIILSSSMLYEVNEPSVILSMQLKRFPTVKPQLVQFSMTPSKAMILLHELQNVYHEMEEL